MPIKDIVFKPVPITFLAMWRVLFGAVLLFECVGSNLVGWTKLVFIDPPELMFTFIGFEWLPRLTAYGYYSLYFAMGLLGLLVMIGYRYRTAMILFTICWMYVYFQHKSSYNNHHYLMWLLCILMCFLPANKSLSLDVAHRRVGELTHVPFWNKLLFIALLLVVYTYAAIAKIYPDWVQGKVVANWFLHKHDLPVIGKFYAWEYTKYLISWGGIAFDLLIIPALLFKPTRNLAFGIGVFFHLTNSITFQIGTFPYMMIASAVFFYSDKTVRKLIPRKLRSTLTEVVSETPSIRQQNLIAVTLCVFFLIQLYLPLRHHIYPGNVLWTEEGHRLSWRMMLRSKYGYISFRIVKPDGTEEIHDTRSHLSREQLQLLPGHPDAIWQYCQYLKRINPPESEIYVNALVNLNFRTAQHLIKPDYNMAKAEWNRFSHSEWIAEEPKNLSW